MWHCRVTRPSGDVRWTDGSETVAVPRRRVRAMSAAVVSLLLVVAVVVPGPSEVGGLIPPRYDMAQNHWWEKTAVRPASPRHQTTSYRVYNSAGPLPPYSFAVNSVGPKPSCHPLSSCAGRHSASVYSSSSGGAGPVYSPPSGGAGLKLPTEYGDSANSAGPRPPSESQMNSVGPKPTPGYQPPAANTVGPKPPRDFPSAHNSVGPKLPPFVSNSVGPKLPPGYTYPTNSVGPKLPTGVAASASAVGPKPPQGYTFSVGPKLDRDVDVPDTPAAPPQPPAVRKQTRPETVSVRAHAQASVRASAHAQASVHGTGSGREHSRARAHAHAQAGDRESADWEHSEKEVKTSNGHKSSVPLGRSPPCDDSCPEYQLVSRTARYEVRLYPAIVWISYVTATENRLLAEMEAQAGIEDYLDGANSQGVRLSRSFPTLTQLQFSPTNDNGKQPGGDFSVSVPLLAELHPPRPSTDQVVLDSVDQQRVFVMAFWARPWKLTDRSLRMRTRRFSRRLRRHGETFLDEYFYLAKYKGPDSEHRSYYEIWLYGTPHESTHRFRPMGRRLLDRRSNLTIATMRRLCRGRECPRFEVLSELPGGIQKRHYYNAAFATSRLEQCESSLTSVWHSLMPLHLYREGINTHLERIERTRPAGILRVWQEGGHHSHLSSANVTTDACHMTVMVYLPRRLHRSPPNTGTHAPTIGLSYIHELTVYVQTAGDLDLGSGQLDDHVADFHERLDQLGLCYKNDEYFIAVYDDVQRYHGRLNEIWTVAQRCTQPGEDVF